MVVMRELLEQKPVHIYRIRMRHLLLHLALLFSFTCPVYSRLSPFVMRISCGAQETVRTPPTNTRWFKDFGYTGGLRANATRPSYVTPPLETLRYFPLSDGPENCYDINKVPSGRYAVRIFFGLLKDSDFDAESFFDVSIEGTQIYSLSSGWSNGDADRAFVEAIMFLTDGTASLCFHSTGHGDPAVMAIEMLQVDDKSYYLGPEFGQSTILRTVKRLSCGSKKPKFGIDYDGDPWGGDRFWSPLINIDPISDTSISTTNKIKQASNAPNFYPSSLYQTALASTDWEPNLSYILEVDPNKNYSIWLHFAEVDTSINGIGQRVFDILINGIVEFKDIDIVDISGDVFTALVLNRTFAIHGRTLTITLRPIKGSHALINAIEVFEAIASESRTLPDEVRALHLLENTLGLPSRFGWSGDPCVPTQHTWSGVDCHFDDKTGKWVIDGLALDNQGLEGSIPKEISQLRHLRNLNLSSNSIHGTIPSSLGNITKLQMLDLSHNSINGSVPDSIGLVTSLRTLNLNGNSLSGQVPSSVGGMLLRRASLNFTDNAGLCGIPGLPKCGPDLSLGAKVGIGIGSVMGFTLIVLFSVCWWKRRQNILRAKRIAARDAPYAKARTHFSRDVQMSRPRAHDPLT